MTTIAFSHRSGICRYALWMLLFGTERFRESSFLNPRILKFFRVKRFGTLWIQAFWTRARQSTQPTRTICTEIDQNDEAMIEDFSSTFDFSSTVLPIDTTSDYSELHHRNLRQTSNLRVLEFARKSKRKLEKSLLENN